jgi:hypothetical protein
MSTVLLWIRCKKIAAYLDGRNREDQRIKIIMTDREWVGSKYFRRYAEYANKSCLLLTQDNLAWRGQRLCSSIEKFSILFWLIQQ